MKPASFMRVALMALLFVALGCQQAPPAQRSQSLDADNGELFRKVIAATGTVLKDGEIAGAGAFVRADGLFLTAAHVVHGFNDRVEVLRPNGSTLKASVVATDLGHDLALLQVNVNSLQANEWLPLSSALPMPGTPIYVVGAPLKMTDVWIPGRVGRDRTGFNYLGNLHSYVHSQLILADAAPGSSGGCWVDGAGRVVGVQSAFIGDNKGSLGLAFMAPASAAVELIRLGKDKPTATLGAELVWLPTQGPGFQKRFPSGAQGVAVHQMREDSPLKKAGIAKDFLITHLNGNAVKDVPGMNTAVRKLRPGTRVRLTVVSPDQHEVTQHDVVLSELSWK